MKEFRCIVFNEQEAITAVVERRRQQREVLPIATIHSLTYNADGNNTSTLDMVDDYGKKIEVPIGVPEMAAALVYYCLTRKIPMPMSAKKGIEVLGKDVTLVMTIGDYDMSKPRSKTAKPGVRPTPPAAPRN